MCSFAKRTQVCLQGRVYTGRKQQSVCQWYQKLVFAKLVIISTINKLESSFIIELFSARFENTVNQLLFAASLFRDLPKINWFATTILRDHALSIHTSFVTTLMQQRLVHVKKYYQ